MEGEDGSRQYTRSQDAFVAAYGKGANGDPSSLPKAGKPIGKLVQFDEAEKPKKRRIGFMEGETPSTGS